MTIFSSLCAIFFLNMWLLAGEPVRVTTRSLATRYCCWRRTIQASFPLITPRPEAKKSGGTPPKGVACSARSVKYRMIRIRSNTGTEVQQRLTTAVDYYYSAVQQYIIPNRENRKYSCWCAQIQIVALLNADVVSDHPMSKVHTSALDVTLFATRVQVYCTKYSVFVVLLLQTSNLFCII